MYTYSYEVATIIIHCIIMSRLITIATYVLVSRSQTAFSVFLWGGGKKGLVWFTVATRLGTFEVLIYRVIIDLGL